MPSASVVRTGVFGLLVAAFVLRFIFPNADPAPRLSWSNDIFTDGAVMVHAARNKALFGEWIRDYNHDYFIFPCMNWLTSLSYSIFGVGRNATLVLSALLGTATCGFVAWGVGKALGRRATLIAALLGAVCYWTTMFSRVPVAENLVAALLAAACALLTSSSPRALAAAGAVAVFATLFGKYHAVGALPGLLAFVALRHRSWRSTGSFVSGGTVVAIFWLVAFFLPHRELIQQHVQHQSTGFHGPLPFAVSFFDGLGEFYNTYRRSWVFYRMPVEAVLGGLFVFWTLGNGTARRDRIRDGSAVWAFWFASIWIYYSLLPYKGPRYYILVTAPLIACAAAQIEKMLRSPSLPMRPPARVDEFVPLLVWLYTFSFGWIDSVKHYASMFLEWAILPPPRISETVYQSVVGVFQHVDTFLQNLAWAAVLTVLGMFLVLWHPEVLRRTGTSKEWSGAFIRRLAGAAIVVAVVFGLGQYVLWVTHRTYYLHEIKSSIAELVGKDAVLLGPLAPLLTQDTKLKSLPYFGPPGEKGLLAKYGVTHVVICGAGDVKELDARYAGLNDASKIVQGWPIRTFFASTLELKRIPGSVDGVPIHQYRPTFYEEAATAAELQDWQGALRALESLKAEHGGKEIPEALSLEAVCSFKLDDLPKARRLLEACIRTRPMDPLHYQNLGVLELREGQRSRALELWMTALRLDPKNEDLERRIRELAR